MAYINKKNLEDFALDFLDIDLERMIERAEECIEPKTGGEMALFVEKNKSVQLQVLSIVQRYDFEHDEIFILCAAFMAIDKAFGYRTKMYDLLSSAHQNKAYEDKLGKKRTKDICWTNFGKYIMENANFKEICLPFDIPIYDTPMVENVDSCNKIFKEKTGIYINDFLANIDDISCEKTKFLRHIFDFYIDDKYIDGYDENTKEATKEDIVYLEKTYARKIYQDITKTDMKIVIDIMFTVRYEWGCKGLTRYS